MKEVERKKEKTLRGKNETLNQIDEEEEEVDEDGGEGLRLNFYGETWLRGLGFAGG